MNLNSIAKLLVERPRLVVLIFTIITVGVSIQASNLHMVSDFANYLPQDDPTLELYNQINEEFQLGTSIIIYINQTGRAPDDIRDPHILQEMDQIYENLFWIPQKYGQETGIKSIESLAVSIRNENNKPKSIGGNGVFELPETQQEIYDYIVATEVAALKGILYTTDYRYAVIIIQLEQDADIDSVLSRTGEAVNNRGTKYANMTITGTIPMQKAIQKKSMKNLLIVFPITLVLISAVILLFHRSLKGIIIAFLPPMFALALTFGTLGTFTPQLTLISVAIVALLLGLGVDYSIHLMNRLSEEKNIEDKIKRIEKILRTTGKAILLSTITTFIGFGSLMISSMDPMVTFGFGCAVGILYCFVSSMVLVPCLVLILDFEAPVKAASWKKLARFAIKNKKRVMFIAISLAVLSMIVLPQIKSDVNYFDMAPSGVKELDALFDYSEQFGGGGNYNVFLLETDPYGLEDPEVIEAIYEMEVVMRTKGVTVASIADSLKQLHEYTGVLDSLTISQALENLTDLDNMIFDRIAENGIVNEDHSKTIIVVTIPVGKSIQEIEQIVDELNEVAENWYIPRNGEVSMLTGQDAIQVVVNNKLSDEQSRSMILALLLVLAALILIFNSSKYGLLTMIPVCFVLMWEPGFLVIMDIPLSPITITIASIMVGIGIDYGVHITHRLREELEKGLTKDEAIATAIEKTGISLVEAALTTIAGMASIYFIGIPALSEFVTVVIFMTGVSVIAAALILPTFFKLSFIK